MDWEDKANTLCLLPYIYGVVERIRGMIRIRLDVFSKIKSHPLSRLHVYVLQEIDATLSHFHAAFPEIYHKFLTFELGRVHLKSLQDDLGRLIRYAYDVEDVLDELYTTATNQLMKKKGMGNQSGDEEATEELMNKAMGLHYMDEYVEDVAKTKEWKDKAERLRYRYKDVAATEKRMEKAMGLDHIGEYVWNVAETEERMNKAMRLHYGDEDVAAAEERMKNAIMGLHYGDEDVGNLAATEERMKKAIMGLVLCDKDVVAIEERMEKAIVDLHHGGRYVQFAATTEKRMKKVIMGILYGDENVGGVAATEDWAAEERMNKATMGLLHGDEDVGGVAATEERVNKAIMGLLYGGEHVGDLAATEERVKKPRIMGLLYGGEHVGDLAATEERVKKPSMGVLDGDEDVGDVLATQEWTKRAIMGLLYAVRNLPPLVVFSKHVSNLNSKIHELKRRIGDEICPWDEKSPNFPSSSLADNMNASPLKEIAVGFMRHTRDGIVASPMELEDLIVGRVSEKEQLIRSIFSSSDQEHPNMISVYGESGIGKTALVKLVFNHVRDQSTTSFFDLFLWVSSSMEVCTDSELGIKRIIYEIIRSVTPQTGHRPIERTMKSLRGRLRDILQGRKYLLVLDDLESSEVSTLKELAEIFKLGSQGSTIILISHCVQDTFRNVKGVHLVGLPETESRSLLTRYTPFAKTEAQEYPLLDGIVNTCHGNPLAIKTLGNSLRASQDEHTWAQTIFQHLSASSFPDIHCNIPSFAFHFSIQTMPYDLIQCYLASAILFESKAAVCKDQLLYFWMAHGLLPPSKGYNDLKDIVDVYCNELLSRGFLQVDHGNYRANDTFRMHEQARHIVKSISGIDEDGVVLSGFRLFQIGRQLLWNRGHFPSSDETPRYKGRAILFEHYTTSPHDNLEMFISNWPLVRVLLLERSEFEELPKAIGDLKLLRYLSLEGNNMLKSLPDSICDLVNLQTLDLSGCVRIIELPKAWRMLKLVSLRHFLFSGTRDDVLGQVPKGWTSMRFLKICHCRIPISLSEQIANLVSLRVLRIHHCPAIASLPSSIKCLVNLKELIIVDCQSLDLTGWDGLDGLTCLQFLQLQGLPELTQFPKGLQSAGGSLQRLVVINCKNLKALPNCLQECTSLLELVIESCPNLVAPCEFEKGEDWPLISHIPKIELDHQVIQPRAASTLKKHLATGEPSNSEPEGSSTPNDINNDVKEIFSLLPEDYEFDKDTLIQLWMAMGYIHDESAADGYFASLLSGKSLLCSGTNFVTKKNGYRKNISEIKNMSDGQNDKSSSYLKWGNECQENTNLNKVQHVSIVRSEIDDETFRTLEKFNELRTLLFLANYGSRVREIPYNLFMSLKKLQALDLSRTHIKKLPSSVGHMIQLRYLDLSWTLIEWLPDVICYLSELQTLKLRGCSELHVLPGQLKWLTKLRHLDIDVLCQLETMPNGIGALISLQTLSAFLVSREDGCKIQELKDLNNLTGNFCIAMLENVGSAREATQADLRSKEQLKKLELRWSPFQISNRNAKRWSPFQISNRNDKVILKRLRPCSSLEELQILCYKGSAFPAWISSLHQLISITFYECKHVKKLPPIEYLPLLQHLELAKMNGVKKIKHEGKEKQAAFSRLEKLEVDEMKSLKSWTWVKTNEGDFKSLVELSIKSCPRLTKFDVLPSLSSIKHLEMSECQELESISGSKLPNSLKNITVEDCPKIKKKYALEGEDWQNIQHIPNKRIWVADEDGNVEEEKEEEES